MDCSRDSCNGSPPSNHAASSCRFGASARGPTVDLTIYRAVAFFLCNINIFPIRTWVALKLDPIIIWQMVVVSKKLTKVDANHVAPFMVEATKVTVLQVQISTSKKFLAASVRLPAGQEVLWRKYFRRYMHQTPKILDPRVQLKYRSSLFLDTISQRTPRNRNGLLQNYSAHI